MAKIDDLLTKAFSCWENGNIQDARNFFLKALKFKPNNPDLLSYVGILDVQLGNFESGINYFKKANIFLPHNKDITLNYSNALINYANYEINNKNFTSAISHLEESIKILPENEIAYLNLFKLYIQEKKYLQFEERFVEALKVNSKNANFYFLHGNCLFDQKKYDAALEAFKLASRLNADFFESIFHEALCHEFLGNIDSALNKYESCLNLKPNYELALFNKGQFLLSMDNYAEGWPLYRYRWTTKKNIGEYLFDPNSELSDLVSSKHRVLVWGEQGIGDQIIFASMLNDFKKIFPNLTVMLDKRLIPIFKRSFADINFLDFSQRYSCEFDFHIPLGNIGIFVRKKIEDFKKQKKSFLISEKNLNKEIYSEIRKNKKLICGISWTSKNDFYGESKSISLDCMSSYLKEFDFKFVNLEYVDNHQEVNKAIEDHSIDIYNPDQIDKFNDLESLAALISNCDLVITVSNVNAHFAGALGIKTLLITPFNYGRLWYWSDKNYSKWYPSVKIFRQKEQNSWKKTLEELKDHLANS